MISSQRTSTNRKSTDRKLELYPHQEIEFLAQQTHDLIISIGGVGSGKTTSFVLWLLDRMQWDTAQMHALFAHTTVQLRAVMRIIYKQLDRIPGVGQRIFNCRPPKEWRIRWEKLGIQTPTTQDRYENVVIWPTGLHLQLGTLHNRSYEQYRGAEWGSVGVEEATLQGVTRDAIDFLFERTRCGESDEGVDCRIALGHRHTKILHGNPPESPDHWTWELLDTLEKSASVLPGAIKSEGEGYPNLIRGLGSAILITSKTSDNPRLPKAYIENQLARLDSETAQRRLGGALTRTKIGRVYGDFTKKNEYSVAYDPNRSVYPFLDFNRNPAVCGFAHPLNPGDYPSENERAGIKHIGVFGEFFHVGGMDAYEMANAILRGEWGSGGHFPDNWKGLANHEGPVIAFGDATARNKRMAGPNEWQIVNDVFRNGTRDQEGRSRYSVSLPDGGNPLVVFGVRSVNAKLCSAAGVRSLHIDPRCTELIADLLTCVWDKTGTDIQKYGERGGSKMHLRTHLSDGLRYMIHQLFPLGNERPPEATVVKLRPRKTIPDF
jgi:hypothetical protein